MSYSIKLTWDNQNNPGVDLRIYRSESPIDRDNPGTPLATIDASLEEYNDTTVVFGVKYYYYLEAFKGTDVARSRVYEFYAKPYTGPGPQELIAGDMNYGYFGSISAAEFISNQALVTFVNLTNFTHNTTVTQVWHKFAYNGKLYYAPDQRVSGNPMPWTSYYTGGLVYGDKKPARLPTGVVEAPQNKRIVINGSEFILRLPTAFASPEADGAELEAPANYASLGAKHASVRNSMIELFFAPNSNSFFARNDLPRVSNWVLSTAIGMDSSTMVGCELISGQSGQIAQRAGITFNTGTNAPGTGVHWMPILVLDTSTVVKVEVRYGD